MSIENEILRLQNAKAALKSSINAKGGTIDGELLDAYPAFVDAIQTGGASTWQPNPAWPDLKTIIDNDTENYIGKVAVLYTDDIDEFSFDLSAMKAQAVKTSDGQMYTTNAAHTWDKQQDINETRWVIWYYSDAASLDIVDNSQLSLGLAKWVVIGSNGTQFNWRFIGTFSGFVRLESIETYGSGTWDISGKTSMYNMFSYCYSLQTIPLLDTSQVTNMQGMFSYCYSLQTIPLLDTSRVASMQGMFSYCNALRTIPLLDTSQVTNMISMFSSCGSLQTIPQLDTSRVASMQNMFSYCNALRTIPQLDTSSAINMISVFDGCNSLTKVNIDTSSCTSFDDLFDGCAILWSIGEIDLSGATDVNSIDTDTFDITFTPNTINIGITISRPELTHDSLLSLIAGLVDRSATTSENLVIGATNIAKLSQAELDQITTKNWTYS
jgi:surface protein